MLWFTLLLVPFVASIVVYLFMRTRRVPIWFDIFVIAVASAWPAIIWFRPRLIANGTDLLEVQDMAGVLVPFWSLVIGVPVLSVGALLRRLFFASSSASSDF